jgi:hypothetical protein
MAIYPKPNHTIYGVLIGKTKSHQYLCLDLYGIFVFLVLLFQVGALDPSFGHLHHHECHHLAQPLGVYQPISYHLEQRVSTPKFFQLFKTKLELSASSKPA